MSRVALPGEKKAMVDNVTNAIVWLVNSGALHAGWKSKETPQGSVATPPTCMAPETRRQVAVYHCKNRRVTKTTKAGT